MRLVKQGDIAERFARSTKIASLTKSARALPIDLHNFARVVGDI